MGLVQDVAYALRTLRRAPGYAAGTILTLAVGIGAVTAIFSVVNAVLLRPLPYRDSSRLVHLFASDAGAGTSYRSFELWKAQSHSFEEMAVYYKNTGIARVTISGGGEPESVQAGFVSANLLPMLGLPPSIGRVFTGDEERRLDRMVVLSDALWRRQFGGSFSVIGQTLQVDGTAFTIIGVMPAVFQFPARETQLWLPITTHRGWQDRLPKDNVHSRGFFMRWNVVAKLRPNVSVEAAQAEMRAIGKRLDQEDPDLNMGAEINVVPVSVEINQNARLALITLLASVVFVLLIACANAANLMLARGAARRREMEIRAALGASHGRLLRQMLKESVTVALIAGTLGLILANVAVRLLVRMGPPELPRLEQTSTDGMVLGFAIVISILAAILAGLLPAARAGEGASTSSVPRRSRARNLLVVSQFALSVVLLAGSGLLIRSLWELLHVDPGFQPEHVLTMRVRYPDQAPEARRAAFYDRLLARVRQISGVQAAGGITSLFEPANSGASVSSAWPPRVRATWRTVSGDYFQAMGATLLTGRFFSEQDGPDAPLVAVIDESMARRYWPDQNPIGQRFKGFDARGKNDDWLTVIGVVRNMRREGLEHESSPHVFEWYRQAGQIIPDLVVRTVGDPAALSDSLSAVVREIDPAAAVVSIMTMREQLDMQSAVRRFQTWLLSLFAGIALLLAGIGIYGVMSYSIMLRTHEIGIRMAIGATAASVLRMVLRQGLSLALTGIVAGLLGALWLTRLLAGMLFGIKAADPITFLTVSVVLVGVGVAATLAPAWRAAQVDPLTALRHD